MVLVRNTVTYEIIRSLFDYVERNKDKIEDLLY